MRETVLVLDFGGQYKELIASTVRKLSVYSEIRSGNISTEEILKINPIGIILTGGPNSVYLENSAKCDPQIFELGIPVLGICYGMHLMCHTLGGTVASAGMGEYGVTSVTSIDGTVFGALMSHRDAVKTLPEDFTATAHTENCIASFENPSKKALCCAISP